MKLPAFKDSKRFVEEIELPCLVAKIKNSNLPGVAARHIAESGENPMCEIFLRGKDKISAWQQEILVQLLEKEGLAGAIEEALAEYGEDSNAYCSKEERAEIKKHGFAPFIWLSAVVIDDIKREVFLIGGSERSVHIPEHGLTICLSKSRWRWDGADHFIRYQAGLKPDEVKSNKADEETKTEDKIGRGLQRDFWASE